MSTVTETLKHKSTRWKFVAFVSLLSAVLLFVRYGLFPAQLDASASAFTNFGARSLEAASIALLAGLVIHAIALWLGPDQQSISLIRILDRAIETTPAFEKAFETTKVCWYFKGGFGSYFRDTTLPTLIKKKKTGLEVMIAVVDIRDQSLVQEYADYRRQASGDKKITPEKVCAEIKETIKTLANFVNQNGGAFSAARVAFVPTYSPFRLDFHDNGVVLTQDNGKAPAIEFGPDSTYYQGFKQEFNQLRAKSSDLKELAKRITLTDEKSLFAALNIT